MKKAIPAAPDAAAPTSQVDVRQRIRSDIVEGVLPFGARITIDELATRYGVSHMPVREALRDLQVEELVVIEPNRGARVRPVDLKFVSNLFEMRTALEGMLMRQAARRCTAADAAALSDIEDRLEQAMADRSHAAVIAENHNFHRKINSLSDNPESVTLVDRHWTLIAALWRQYGYGPDRFVGVANDHRHLITALRQNDAEAASTIMIAHVIKARQNLVERARAHLLAQESAGVLAHSRARRAA